MGFVSIKHSDRDYIKMFEDERRKRQKPTKKQGGYFAGGTCGCIVNIGGQEVTIGKHPLVAVARYLGYNPPVTRKSLNIFDAGYQNEYSWEDYLNNKFNFSYRAEYPMEGSIIRTEVDFEDSHGIVELKGVMSDNTAKKVFGKWEPKTDNLIQAGLYSLLSGKPNTLVYSQHCNFGKLKADKVQFPIGWDNGVLYFVRPDGGRQNTIITESGIRGYYDDILYLVENKIVKGFERGHYDYEGKPDSDWDRSDHMVICLQGVSTWDDYINRLEIIASVPCVLTPIWGRGLKVMGYELVDLDDNPVETFETVSEAQEGFFKLGDYRVT